MKKKNNVAIFCDGNNLQMSIQHLLGSNFNPNFDNLIPFVLGWSKSDPTKMEIMDLMFADQVEYFGFYREGEQISAKLGNRLYSFFGGKAIPCGKQADVDIVWDMARTYYTSNNINKICLLTGDIDIIEKLEHFHKSGCSTEVFAFQHSISESVFKLPYVDKLTILTPQVIDRYNLVYEHRV
jgi:hypothetical protein